MTTIAPMAPNEMEALKKLLEYTEFDEEEHFEECMDEAKTPEDKAEIIERHVYSSIKVLREFVDRWDNQGE